MEEDRKALENVRGRAAEDEIAIGKGERLIGELQGRITGHRAILAERDSITANYTRLLKLRVRERELAGLAHQQREVQGEIHRLERLIDARATNG